MVLAHLTRNPCHFHDQPTIIPSIIIINIPHHKKLVPWTHILDFADSSSTLVWMQKGKIDPIKEEIHDIVLRWFGWTLISSKA